jgi:hypothetical protein
MAFSSCSPSGRISARPSRKPQTNF